MKIGRATLVLAIGFAPIVLLASQRTIPVHATELVAPASLLGTEEPLRSGLRVPEDYFDAVFAWPDRPDWTITQVTLGVRDGGLTFAKYLAITPAGVARWHDNTGQVDWLVQDSMDLPSKARMETRQSGSVYLESFSFRVAADGRAYFDSMSGYDARGGRFDWSGPGGPDNGICGAPFASPGCTGTFCSGACTPDLPDADPCDCNANGWCTDGTAAIVCPVGSCTRACVFAVVAGTPTCACIAPCGAVSTYCSAKANSMGCESEIAWSGAPSLSNASQFVMYAQLLLENKNGLIFFGTNGPSNAPFQGGFLCVKPPLYRLSPQSTGATGFPPCSGELRATLANMLAHPQGGPQIQAGGRAWAQAWSRDPNDPFTTNLSGGLEIIVCP